MDHQLKGMDWNSDFSAANEFEFSMNEMYEILEEEEYEMNGEKYVPDIDGHDLNECCNESDGCEAVSCTAEYNRDECRINALLFYAMTLGLGCKVDESHVIDGRRATTLHLESPIYDAELTAAFMCNLNSGEKAESKAERIEVFTEINGYMEQRHYSLTEATQVMMNFIEYAAGKQEVSIATAGKNE